MNSVHWSVAAVSKRPFPVSLQNQVHKEMVPPVWRGRTCLTGALTFSPTITGSLQPRLVFKCQHTSSLLPLSVQPCPEWCHNLNSKFKINQMSFQVWSSNSTAVTAIPPAAVAPNAHPVCTKMINWCQKYQWQCWRYFRNPLLISSLRRGFYSWGNNWAELTHFWRSFIDLLSKRVYLGQVWETEICNKLNFQHNTDLEQQNFMTEVFPYVRIPDGLSAPCDALEVCSTYSFKLNFYILFIVESLKGSGLGSTQILFERV